MKLLVFDNYDSFTYNLVHIVKKLGFTDVEVHRNDRISLEEINRFDKIILSPGPGVPSESGILLDLIKTYASSKSIFGVCLGVQAIAEAFGGSLLNLPQVYHGIASEVSIFDDEVLFRNLPETITAGRYHSWVVNDSTLPPCLQVTAKDEQGTIMALKHRTLDVRGVQFHPESVLTPLGEQILKNWLEFPLSGK
ncbi:MAG: aminodeoxychorismate/anthranilate synthase component II [Paludibacteraceae bacterium]|jgi:anthranilate synthase component 2|nr:aminodeoxychorismate/anthranilate synthase component II [Paludibacteraceae bacterium]HOR39155.1 aminodeoxychorismate/anthranilate synthase component II [Paludibacteraceae bacterium]HPL76253.1 aminodeoxychorismate/anthranilate synthase component II [Paludibacteraceae bacterium]HQG67186.1 aminodeoxychorismate/anthranilate synthase component II [Paludibacteraceae bacterium]